MIPSEHLSAGSNYTWTVSPEYIELNDSHMVLRIPNGPESHIKFKTASATLGDHIVFYGDNDMKLYLEESEGMYNVYIFMGRKNVLKYTNRLFGSLFRLMKIRHGPLEERTLPTDARNAVTFASIENGTRMVDFHSEFQHGRYYTQETFDRIPEPKLNPFTRRPITAMVAYKAKVR